MIANPIQKVVAAIGRPYENGGFYPLRLAIWAIPAALAFAGGLWPGLVVSAAFYVLLLRSFGPARGRDSSSNGIDPRRSRDLGGIGVLATIVAMQLPAAGYFILRSVEGHNHMWAFILILPVVSWGLWSLAGGDRPRQDSRPR